MVYGVKDDTKRQIRRFLLILLTVTGTMACIAKEALPVPLVHVDIPRGPLGESLALLERQAGVPIGCDVPLDKQQLPGPRVVGDMTISQALHVLLPEANSVSGPTNRPSLTGEPAEGGVECPQAAQFHIEAGDATPSLNEFSRQSKLQLLFDFAVVSGRRTAALDGINLDPSIALRILLEGTNLTFNFVNSRTLAIASEPAGVLVASAKRMHKWWRGPIRPGRGGEGLQQVIIAAIEDRGVTLMGAAEPVSTRNREDIDSTGLTNAPDLLRTMPQTFGGGATDHTQLGREANTNSTFGNGVNLRGLDAGATLVLLDGRRLAGSGTDAEYTDITPIPLSAIDHVDIVADGTSTRYGADSVAGVVNFVTRKNFTGSETLIGAGRASGGVLSERGFGQLIGHNWDAGRGMVTFDYYQRGSLPAADRAQATNNLIPFGGIDFRLPYGSPGTIVIGPQTWAAPALNGRALTASLLQPNAENLYDQRAGTDILPSQERLSLLTDVSQSFGDRADVWFNTWLSSRKSLGVLAPGAQAMLLLPANNPFYVNPTGGTGPIEVLYGFGSELGPLTIRVGVSSGSSALGTHLDVGGWKLTGDVEYSFENGFSHTDNALNFTFLNAALSSSNPLAAFNPFAETNSQLLQAIRTTLFYHSYSDISSLNLSADRSLTFGPGKHLELGIGGAFRREGFKEDFGGNVPGAAFARPVVAGFGELKVPLIGESGHHGWARRVEFSLGARYEDYPQLGSILSPKISALWTVVPQISFRGTWGRAARPPAVTNFDESHNRSGLSVLSESKSSGGTTVLVWNGGNADLHLERSATWTLGTDFAPAPDLSVGITYFNIADRGRIDQLFLTENALTDPTFLGSIIRDPSAAQRQQVCDRSTFFGPQESCLSKPIGAIVDLRAQNLDTLRTQGLDISGNYSLEGSLGRFAVGLNATYLLGFSQARTGAAPLELLDTVHNPIDWRARGSLSWKRGAFTTTAFLNYAGGYRDTASTPLREIDSWATLDFSLQYEPGVEGPSWLGGTTLALSIQNAFDAQAPFVNDGARAVGYDEENAGLTGRVLGFRIRHTLAATR